MTSILLNVLSGGEGENEKVKQQLINNVKREIKQLMEEAVTRRYIYIQSGSVNSLCGAVEACLSHGLKRKALGLFKTSSTTALIQKIRKNCAEAEHVNRCLMKWEGSADDCTNITMKSMMVKSTKYSTPISSDCIIKAKLLAKDDSTLTQSININSAVVSKYLWIRVALYEKHLVRIINHLVDNAKLYYDGNALVADTDYGFLLSSLLVGPCALDFTKTKTIEHYWSDPPADELVQRHRISSGNRTPPICHRPLLNFKRSLHTSSEESNSGSFKTTSPAIVAKDYVESLHQNSHATLLYGKNNVLVLPKDFIEPIPGYLSLHRTIQSLIIKWTPNQLMNICNDKNTTTTADGSIDLNMYWNYAFNINVDDIVYVHCHQNNGDDNGGTIILVGHDGVQRPPIHFPEGGHMLLFLGCLETGLLPHGQLDPPLWSQRTRGQAHNFWPRRIQERIFSGISTRNTENSFDYVFRVIRTTNREELAVFHSLLVLGSNGSRHKHLSSCSTNGSSDCSSKSLSLEQNLTDQPLIQSSKADSIELVCSSMKRQIISRAFYGWLAYCRHLSTVRTHLSGLVNYQIIPELEPNENGLTEITWLEMHDNGKLLNDMHIYRLVYFGGVPHKLRAKVWPYLLGHYSFGSTIEERAQLTINTKHCYETTMSEWLAVEAIVQQRDIEKNVKSSGNVIYTESVQNLQSDVIMENENEEQIKSEIFEDDHQELSDVSDIEVTHKNEIITGNALTDPFAITEKNTSGDEEFQLQKSNLNLNFLNVESQNADISPSTSSYETVVNEFNDVSEIFRNVNSPDIETKISLKEEYVEDYDTPEEINRMDYHEADNNSHNLEDVKQQTKHSVAITDADDSANHKECLQESSENTLAKIGCISIPNEDRNEHKLTSLDIEHTDHSICASPASSNGGVYSCEFLENFALNLHRIDKDVQRCDRNYSYFAKDNLNKLRNIITTYVWKHLDIGYMQGMCDLVAPLLVVFDDEALTYSCFCKFMERMIDNFPNGGAMDMHFANMRSLIQILDAEMYELMDSNGDYTHFYFCYRWFLLDFKRELLYDDIFATWEVIWAAKHVASTHFVLFFALALLETYRDIILSNSMDFTDIIKFFNEMAERHNVQAILKLARNLVLQLQTIIENK